MTDAVAAAKGLLTAPVTIIVGHYGVGKTSFALNLALASAKAGFATTLADLDVVNPYFRATEYRDLLETASVKVVAPVFSERGSNLDVPSLNGAIVPAIEEAQAHPGEQRLIIDAGGDDAGATALGRFAPLIAQGDYAMIYVVNSRRLQTAEADEALEILREIEAKARLSATGVVSNAHLKAATDEDVVKQGIEVARQTARLAGLDFLAYTLAPGMTAPLEGEDAPAFPLNMAVRAPWE